MKPLKGFLCLVLALFVSQASYGQSKSPQLRIDPAGNLEIVSSGGKIYSFKSITLQESVVIDGVSYKVSFGPGASSGDMVAILQPSTATKVTVNDTDFPRATVDISSQALAIFTFNAKNRTVVVESGSLGVVKVNGLALGKGERVAVNPDGTLVRNLGSGPAPGVAPTVVAENTPGQTAENSEQPVPEVTDFAYGPGSANNLLASMAINLSPEAATPYLPGQ